VFAEPLSAYVQRGFADRRRWLLMEYYLHPSDLK
jgi:hypothetical protein